MQDDSFLRNVAIIVQQAKKEAGNVDQFLKLCSLELIISDPVLFVNIYWKHEMQNINEGDRKEVAAIRNDANNIKN